MYYYIDQIVAIFAQDLDKIMMCIALVAKYRFIHRYRQFELLSICFDLGVVRRKVAVKIEACLTNRPHAGIISQPMQNIDRILRPVARMVRMDTNRTGQLIRVFSTQPNCLITILDTGAGDYNLVDAGLVSALEHRIEVLHQAFIGEIGSDVDKLGQCRIPVPRLSRVMQKANRITIKNRMTMIAVPSPMSLTPRKPNRKLLTI